MPYSKAKSAVLEKSIVKIKGLAVGEKSGVALHGAAANICFKVSYHPWCPHNQPIIFNTI